MCEDNILVVGPGTRVTLHFSVILMDGTLVDTTRGKKPATFSVGDGSLLSGFEKPLFGLKGGDKRSILLQPDQAFGKPNPDNLQFMKRDRFSSDMELKPGLMISFDQGGKWPVPGVIKEINDETVVVDFNHPLAGRELIFEVEIINVVPSDTQSVQIND
jgi:FKBP-type peptidyl-prolyl cis-trans isomerase SlpA